jgi:pSer/pThr/pTyr-binding forkhead associated (FHA) protein
MGKITIEDTITGERHNRSGPTVIGRDRHNHICLSESDNEQAQECARGVSGKHCLIYLKDGEWCVVDSYSRNGTFINDEQLGSEESYALEDGDKLTLGNYNLRIKLKTTLLNERLRR